jgi:hypothetical protein
MIDIFVFGSNLAGIHGAGSALTARKYYGAIQGISIGLQGYSYAIPTQDGEFRTLPLDEIKIYVDEFINFTISHPNFHFNVVAIGCGLAGYNAKQIAPLFRDYSNFNVNLPDEFVEIIKRLNIA